MQGPGGVQQPSLGAPEGCCGLPQRVDRRLRGQSDRPREGSPADEGPGRPGGVQGDVGRGPARGAAGGGGGAVEGRGPEHDPRSDAHRIAVRDVRRGEAGANPERGERERPVHAPDGEHVHGHCDNHCHFTGGCDQDDDVCRRDRDERAGGHARGHPHLPARGGAWFFQGVDCKLRPPRAADRHYLRGPGEAPPLRRPRRGVEACCAASRFC
mmetsp:Transcript_27361/g.87669  ORF Transcript_27361/g.87669 Transcript_27361/m.87669 type:complete len:212 (-) Transcript_27361:138-773(-)